MCYGGVKRIYLSFNCASNPRAHQFFTRTLINSTQKASFRARRAGPSGHQGGHYHCGTVQRRLTEEAWEEDAITSNLKHFNCCGVQKRNLIPIDLDRIRRCRGHGAKSVSSDGGENALLSSRLSLPPTFFGTSNLLFLLSYSLYAVMRPSLLAHVSDSPE